MNLQTIAMLNKAGDHMIIEKTVKVKATLHPERTLFLRQEAATGKLGVDKFEYSMVNFHIPCVRIRGRYVTFSISALVEAAAGIVPARKQEKKT